MLSIILNFNLSSSVKDWNLVLNSKGELSWNEAVQQTRKCTYCGKKK